MTWPAYRQLFHENRLIERIQKALTSLQACKLCPRACGINRQKNELGFCRTGRWAKISSFGPHFGEEAPLVGTKGSGTIFFAECNLRCVFCQNYSISHLGQGEEISAQNLAEIMLDLQNKGVHNINFVTPSHVVPQILEALPYALVHGFNLPLIYNSSGYDLATTLSLLKDIFDIYMPDIKFFQTKSAQQYCQAPDYPIVVRLAIQTMYQQVGDLIVNKQGLAERGLLVRHLLMPDGLADTAAICQFLAQTISCQTYVNIMAQYRPAGKFQDFPELKRRITKSEYQTALQIAKQVGLGRLDHSA